MIDFFHTVLFTPIYNLLMGLTAVLPAHDIGLAVVVVTIIVKVLLMPLSFSALRTQRAIRVLEPKLKELREKYKDDKEKQAREMMALYKEHKINPFAGFATLLIQLPIIISLYWVFVSSNLLSVDMSLLYAFVPVPDTISPVFLGIFAVTGASIILSILAALSQAAYAWLAIPMPERSKDAKPNMQADFGRAMAIQMRFMLPIFIGIAAYLTSVAVALYFITSNLVSLVQELIVRAGKKAEETPTS